MKNGSRASKRYEDPIKKYALELDRFIGIKDRKAKDEMIKDLTNKIRKDNSAVTYDQMVNRYGRPSDIGSRLSDPSNWVIDLGTPLRPKIEVPSFFSDKGRFMLMGIFIFCIAGIIGLIVSGIARDMVLIGSLIILLIYWMVISSLLNDHLGYLSVVKALKGQSLGLDYIDMKYLKRNMLGAWLATMAMMVVMIVLSNYKGDGSLVILLPLCLSSLIALMTACVILYKEGQRTLANDL